MIRGGAVKRTSAAKKTSSKKSPAATKSVKRSDRPSRGTPIEEEMRFKPFTEAPKTIDVAGSKHGFNGKWPLLKSFSKGNYKVHVYALDEKKGPFLAIVHGGFADKATGAWRDKWFWSITSSNPLENNVVSKYLETNFWSPSDMLNGGLLKGSNLYRFEFRELRDKIKHDDSRDFRIKFGGARRRRRMSKKSGGRKSSKRRSTRRSRRSRR